MGTGLTAQIAKNRTLPTMWVGGVGGGPPLVLTLEHLVIVLSHRYFRNKNNKKSKNGIFVN